MEIKRFSIFNYIFVILLSCVIFNGFGIKAIYLGCGILLMAISAFCFFSERYLSSNNKLLVLIWIWLIYHVICAFISFDSNAIYICFQHIGILFFFYMICHMDKVGLHKDFILNYCKVIHLLVLIVLLFVVFITPAVMTNFESYIYIGIATFPCLILDLKKLKSVRIIILCMVWAFLAYTIGARAQVLSFVIYLMCLFLTYWLYKNNKKLSGWLFSLYYGLVNLFPILYSYLSQSPIRNQLDQLAINLSGSRFFSGRDILWLSVYNQMTSPLNIIFGLGFKTTSELVRSNISLHNLYVTLFSEGGIILVVIFGIILFQIWNRLNESDSYISKIMIALLVVVLYKQSFDISLIENNLWVAFSIWMMLGIGVNSDNNTLQN